MSKKVIYIEFNADGEFTRTENGGIGFSFFPPSFVLVANTPRTVIRTGILTAGKKRLSPEAKWDLVKNAFPLGRTLNEDSHIFDGCIYPSTEGEAVFLMTALPLETADKITRIGAKRLGEKRISRLDTIENIIFRRFCAEGTEPRNTRWVLFPQGVGYRALVIARGGAPSDAHYLPIDSGIKEGALLRVYEADAPDEVILLTRDDWTAFWDDNRLWLEGFFNGRDVTVHTVPY
ncbi:MAG: hypothetical protein FWE90_00160 [Defluviitaleaceae bacterium]|nr:hypothetical protein [Defluviitaleaceae bacterium]